MGDDSVRQRYALATGKGLQSAPPKNPNPGFKKGGKVSKPSSKYSRGGSKRGC